MVQNKAIKLNLGCYNKKIYGYVNVDIRPEVEPDLVEDIFLLPSFKPNSVSVIYSAHTLEHGTRNEALKALARWYDILEPGGLLRLAVPNLEEACKHYIYYKDLKQLFTTFYGSGKHAYDFHKTGWDEFTLVQDLLDVGFINPKKYNPFETEHGYVDDYSQAYIGKQVREYSNGKVKIEGRLFSLNIEAIK